MPGASVGIRPVDDPEEEFSQENELNFRREMSTYLIQLSDDVLRAEEIQGIIGSLASKRQALLSPPVGVVRILG